MEAERQRIRQLREKAATERAEALAKIKEARARRVAEREAATSGKAQGASPAARAAPTETAQPRSPRSEAPRAEAGKEPPSQTVQPGARVARQEEGRRDARREPAPSCEAAGGDVALPGWYVVKAGDTLWSIAERHYGAGWRYKRIHAANRRRIRDPHWIRPCQQVYLPRRGKRA